MSRQLSPEQVSESGITRQYRKANTELATKWLAEDIQAAVQQVLHRLSLEQLSNVMLSSAAEELGQHASTKRLPRSLQRVGPEAIDQALRTKISRTRKLDKLQLVREEMILKLHETLLAILPDSAKMPLPDFGDDMKDDPLVDLNPYLSFDKAIPVSRVSGMIQTMNKRIAKLSSTTKRV